MLLKAMPNEPLSKESETDSAALDAAECQQAVAEAITNAVDMLWEVFEEDQSANVYALVLAQVERPLLARTMEHCNHNQSRAAGYLGINRATLRKKLREYNLN